jgi:hypothetical protein
MVNRKSLYLFILINCIFFSDTVNGQVLIEERPYGFIQTFFQQPCKLVNFRIDGGVRYYFVGKDMMFDEIGQFKIVQNKIKDFHKELLGCKEDSIQTSTILTPGIGDLPNSYFKSFEASEKVHIIYNFLKSCLMQADTINKYLKQFPKLNKLVFKIQNPIFSDSIIRHLTNNLYTIDSLIIYDYTKYTDNNSDRMTYPMNDIYFQSVQYLKIVTSNQILIPNYVFESKQKPLETLVLVCDSLMNLEELTKLTSLKKLTFVNTKKMDSIIPLILQLKSLEELYIANTDLKKIPTNLLNLPSLKTLVIIDNNKLKKFPKDIKDYDRLEHLYFWIVSKDGKRKAKKFSIKIYNLSKKYPEKYQTY